jgi:hypothetical protein
VCTVSLIPNKNGFYLTHNRDEKKVRPIAAAPQTNIWFGKNILAPIDTLAFGTWIALAPNTTAMCLLNGAFDKHDWKGPYTKSRGLIIPEYFEYCNIQIYIDKQDWQMFEPFTLIGIEKLNDGYLPFELVWDATDIYYKELNTNKAHLYSSSTLYTKEEKLKREIWFAKFLENEVLSSESIQQFHQFKPELNTDEGFIINRPNGRHTVSLTHINCTNEQATLNYIDFNKQ